MKTVPVHAALVALALPATLCAQTFVSNTTDIPTGGATNNSFTENLSFADVDLDGDVDVIFADGGDLGNDRNRLWINQGGLQGGSAGVFADETATRMPPVQDASRDIDFADIDGDGDLDFIAANTSGVVNQGSRLYVNMGGAQGGTLGFYEDQTSPRYVNVGVNNGSTSSSVDPNIKLVDGNFIDWSCDVGLVDLDGDGDMDLFNATYGDLSQGQVPTRVFLNDGDGNFEEFNPSGFQLVGTDIANGDPGLWCEGTHKHETTDATGAEADVATIAISVDFADIDADYDIDVLHGEKFSLPRVFRNRTEETGALAFRDVSNAVLPGPNWAPGLGSYEQDFGDFDNDGDIDLYGANWVASANGRLDVIMPNDGSGVFGTGVPTTGSDPRHNEPDLFDYDGDGDLDVFIFSETHSEKVYENLGAGSSFAYAEDLTALPANSSSALGGDVADVDQDGDYDVFVANDLGQANIYYQNLSTGVDVTAPRAQHLEQVADRAAGFTPTVVRVHVYDNAPWDVTQYYDVDLEYAVNGGSFVATDMTFSGGQLFRGELPGLTEGAIDYRVRATDGMGNMGLSQTKSFIAGACNGDTYTYCTAKTNSGGCVPAIGWSGSPSASQPNGFVISTTDSLPNKSGLFFYGYTPKQVPYQGGYLCVQAPAKRTGIQNSGGVGPCGGSFSFDFNAHIAGGADPNLQPGTSIYGQYWNRDPGSSFNTIRTDAIAFTICP